MSVLYDSIKGNSGSTVMLFNAVMVEFDHGQRRVKQQRAVQARGEGGASGMVRGEVKGAPAVHFRKLWG